MMRSGTKACGLWVLAALTVALMAPAAWAQTAWDTNKGNCESVLSSPQHYDLDEVRHCTQLWEAYRDVAGISRDEARAVARGFSRLYYQGTSSDETLAQTALSRLGLDVLPQGDFLPDERWEAFLNRDRSTIHVEEASERSRNRARDLNSDGMGFYNDGDFSRAADKFRQALEADPFHHLAKYNLACQLSLMGDYDEAIEVLDELSRWDSDEARGQIAHALGDADLAPLRDDPRFRMITGATRTQILNGAGEAGVARVEELAGALAEASMDVVSVGHDRHARGRPSIWYRRGFEDARDRAIEALELPDNSRTRVIDWDSDYDIIVVWGGAAEARLERPLVQGFTLIISGEPDEVIADTETAVEDAGDAVEDPEGAAEDAAQDPAEWMPGE